MSRHHVVLVPGFFGFGSLGALTYFVGVREALGQAFERLSLDVNVVEVPTLPTASIRHRAALVQETLVSVAEAEPGPIHIVGHSTGGLDARLAIAPTASLPSARKFHEHERLRTLVTLSTPHFGTPLASLFGSAAGSPLLHFVSRSLISCLKHGRLPIGLGLRLGGWVTRVDDSLGFKPTLIDDFFREVIADFSTERRAELIAFIEGVSKDQSLVFQLTAAGCDLLNASTADPDNLRYGSIVCRARAPRLRDVLAPKRDPYTKGMYLLYALLHQFAGSAPADSLPKPVQQQQRALRNAFGEDPESAWSDGVVPTLSQIWGEVIHVASADHLDTVGHYGSGRPGLTSDWLPSKSGFNDEAFDTLWSSVAEFITEEAKNQAVPRHRHNVGVERTQVDPVALEGTDTVSPGPVSAPRGAVTATEQARHALQSISELAADKAGGRSRSKRKRPPAAAQ